MSRIYYTNGVNELRLEPGVEPPEGYYKGRVKSPVTTKDCIWVNNGTKQKLINKELPIPDGYSKGRLPFDEDVGKKKSVTHKEKGYKIYNDGNVNLCVAKDEVVPKGFVKGRLPMSEEQKQKLSVSHMGIHHTEETKRKISLHSNNNREKARKTCLEKYGCEYVLQYRPYVDKVEKTKTKNSTFNTSKPEIKFKQELQETFGTQNVLTNYKCDRYPFRCDFYIPSEDLFIELNLHWTHGGKPYNPEDEDCQKQLQLWQEKAKQSKFYQNAIETWTVRDVKKQKIAKENKLNYKVIYQL